MKRTGTFLTIHSQVERLKTEGVVDFLQSIKSARLQRTGLVLDVVSLTCSTVNYMTLLNTCVCVGESSLTTYIPQYLSSSWSLHLVYNSLQRHCARDANYSSMCILSLSLYSVYCCQFKCITVLYKSLVISFLVLGSLCILPRGIEHLPGQL